MIGRLVHSRDFERMRSVRAWSRSVHFAAHHLPEPPARGHRGLGKPGQEELSTIPAPSGPGLVDNPPDGQWLGTVVPKRLARRSTTRNLLRRQIREAMERHGPGLPPGLWVVRLRAGFAREEFVSAASARLRQAARAELDRLLQRPGGAAR